MRDGERTHVPASGRSPPRSSRSSSSSRAASVWIYRRPAAPAVSRFFIHRQKAESFSGPWTCGPVSADFRMDGGSCSRRPMRRATDSWWIRAVDSRPRCRSPGRWWNVALLVTRQSANCLLRERQADESRCERRSAANSMCVERVDHFEPGRRLECGRHHRLQQRPWRAVQDCLDWWRARADHQSRGAGRSRCLSVVPARRPAHPVLQRCEQ